MVWVWVCWGNPRIWLVTPIGCILIEVVPWVSRCIERNTQTLMIFANIGFGGRMNIHEQLGWTSINSCHVNVLMWTRGKFTGLWSYKQPWTNNSTSHKPSTNHESSTRQASHIRPIAISLLVARLALQSTQIIWWQKHCKNHGFLIYRFLRESKAIDTSLHLRKLLWSGFALKKANQHLGSWGWKPVRFNQQIWRYTLR